VAGDESRATEARTDRRIKINAIWESSSSLVISYSKNAQVFLNRQSVAGVTVKYESTP
jgi:hypothetical protein